MLSRATEHLKKQNWTAIAIDLVVLIVGVFIGIEAANWNSARHESARGLAYLERIHDDLGNDIATFERRLDFWSEVSRRGQIAIRYAEAGRIGDHTNWKVLRSHFDASQIWFFTAANSTFEEMKSAGELDLIRSVELRAALANYYQAAERWRQIFEFLPPYRERIRGRVPSQVLTYMWDQCISDQRFLDCKAPISEQGSGAILRTLASDEEMLPSLRSWNSNIRVMTDIGRTRLKAARDLQRQVEDQLRQRG